MGRKNRHNMAITRVGGKSERLQGYKMSLLIRATVEIAMAKSIVLVLWFFQPAFGLPLVYLVRLAFYDTPIPS